VVIIRFVDVGGIVEHHCLTDLHNSGLGGTNVI